MRSIGYLVYYLTGQQGLLTQYHSKQGEVTRDRKIEKGTFYPNSKQGACAPVLRPALEALI